MRKATILFFILLAGMPTLTHAQPAYDALLGLKKLQARTQAAISYKDYGNALGEAKFPFNLYLESNDAKNYPDLTTSLKKIMAHYEYAEDLWNIKMSDATDNRGYIGLSTIQGATISELYPEANKYISEGGAKSEEYYSIDALLRVIWNEASNELDIATKLYSKYERKKSDETAILKKENAELKKEVARLKKENELLKNRKKVKK